MNRFLRRALIGSLSGLSASPILVLTVGRDTGSLVAVALAAAVGSLLSLPRSARARPGLDLLMEVATLGVPLWALIDVVSVPLLRGEEPRWTAAAMREVFPALAGWISFQAALGLLLHIADDLAVRWFGLESVPPPPPRPRPQRILILGGGFAGVSTAEHLEHRFGASAEVELTLVSETNAMLFTPMLAEVAASSLEAAHITSPLRTGLKRTEVVRGRVVAVDLDRKQASVRGAAGEERNLPYDHVVFALGAVSNYLGLSGVERHAFDFKSIADAIAIRNHVIDCFERADGEGDAEARRRMLTFVVAGGGFAGAELAGGLNDFTRGMLPYYPNVPRAELRIVLVHGRDRILNELSERLALHAQQRMTERGVTFRLNTRLVDAQADGVVLSDGELPTSTLVWTAGTSPNPLLRALGLEVDKRGAVHTDEAMRIVGRADAWAIGDAASIPNAATGKTCPPTAQFAIRQAAQLARNLQATVRGRALRPFRFVPLGALCVVGHHTACAEIKGLRFSGLFAWLLWRGIYLSKLPGLERKVRVVVDWTIELFFPRDIVQTIELRSGGNER